MVEQRLEDQYQKMIWMEKTKVEGGISTVNDALEVVNDSLEYAQDSVDSAADVKRVQDVLDFVRSEAQIIQRYAGPELT